MKPVWEQIRNNNRGFAWLVDPGAQFLMRGELRRFDTAYRVDSLWLLTEALRNLRWSR